MTELTISGYRYAAILDIFLLKKKNLNFFKFKLFQNFKIFYKYFLCISFLDYFKAQTCFLIYSYLQEKTLVLIETLKTSTYTKTRSPKTSTVISDLRNFQKSIFSKTRHATKYTVFYGTTNLLYFFIVCIYFYT